MKPDEHSQSLLTLSLLAILIGIMGGIASWGFRMLIGLIHNFLFLGEFSRITNPQNFSA